MLTVACLAHHVGSSPTRAQGAVDAQRQIGRFALQQHDTSTAAQELHAEMAGVPKGKMVGAGAFDVPEGYFRDAVAILRKPLPGRDWLCTGVLVSRYAVLTAGHCVCNLELDKITPATRNSDIGAIAVGEQADSIVKVTIRSAITLEPDYCRNGQRGRDLGLVFLHADLANSETEFQFVAKPHFDRPKLVAAARLAPSVLYLSSAIRALTVVGFGLSNNNAVGTKKFGVIPIVSRLCGTPLARSTFHCSAGRETVLAGPTADSCAGDSGGPAYVVTGSDYYLAAITSRAVNSLGTCGPGGIYTLITPDIVNWIRTKVGSGVSAYE